MLSAFFTNARTKNDLFQSCFDLRGACRRHAGVGARGGATGPAQGAEAGLQVREEAWQARQGLSLGASLIGQTPARPRLSRSPFKPASPFHVCLRAGRLRVDYSSCSAIFLRASTASVRPVAV